MYPLEGFEEEQHELVIDALEQNEQNEGEEKKRGEEKEVEDKEKEEEEDENEKGERKEIKWELKDVGLAEEELVTGTGEDEDEDENNNTAASITSTLAKANMTDAKPPPASSRLAEPSLRQRLLMNAQFRNALVRAWIACRGHDRMLCHAHDVLKPMF